MTQPNDSQRLWQLERQVENLTVSINRLIRIVEGGDTNGGMKEALADVKREVTRIAKLSREIESLEEIAARKSEVSAMEGRLKTVENRATLDQGASIGRKAIWGIIAGAVAFIAMVLGLLLQVSALVRQVVP